MKTSGKLTFHGVSKPMVVSCTRKGAAKSLTIKGAFDINMTGFNIERPSLLGMKADDALKLKFTAVFAR